MIPYSEMTFGDFDFYWGTSVLFHLVESKWIPVQPVTRDDDEGELVYGSDETLEELEGMGYTITFAHYHRGMSLSVPPLAPFQTADWITYEPELGYFIIDDRLVLLVSNAPRSRHKGLHPLRLRAVLPVDMGSVSKACGKTLSPPPIAALPYHHIVVEVARRLNEPFPASWYLPIVDSLVSTSTVPVILNHNTAFVPEPETDYGYLLLKGTMIGRIQLHGTWLEFSPRDKPSSGIEKQVNAVIQGHLVSVPKVTPIT